MPSPRTLLPVVALLGAAACEPAGEATEATGEQLRSCAAEALPGVSTTVYATANRGSFAYVPSRWQLTEVLIDGFAEDESTAPIYDLGVPPPGISAAAWGLSSNDAELKGSSASPYLNHGIIALEAVPAAAEPEASIREALRKKHPELESVELAPIRLRAPDVSKLRAQLVAADPASAQLIDIRVKQLDETGTRLVARGPVQLLELARRRIVLQELAVPYTHACGEAPVTSLLGDFVYPETARLAGSSGPMTAAANIQGNMARGVESAWTARDPEEQERMKPVLPMLRALVRDIDTALVEAYPYTNAATRSGFVKRETGLTEVHAGGKAVRAAIQTFIRDAFPKLGYAVPSDIDRCFVTPMHVFPKLDETCRQRSGHGAYDATLSFFFDTLATTYATARNLEAYSDEAKSIPWTE